MQITETDRVIKLISAIDAFTVIVDDKKGSKEPTTVECYLQINGHVSIVTDLDPGIDVGKDVSVVGNVTLNIAYINKTDEVVDKGIEVGFLSSNGFVPAPKAIATLGLEKISLITKQIQKSWDLSSRLEAAIAKAEIKKQRARQKRANAITASALF